MGRKAVTPETPGVLEREYGQAPRADQPNVPAQVPRSALLEQAGLIYFRWDLSRGMLLDVSSSVYDVLGWTRVELLSDPDLPARITHPDFVPKLQAMMREWEATRASRFRFEGQYVSRDGREVWLEVSGIAEYSPSGELVGAESLAMDITELVSTRRVAEEASRRYHALFDDAPIPMLLYDPDTFLVIEANRQACQLYGIEREEFEGTFLEDRIAPEEWPRMEERLRRAVGDPRVQIVSRMIHRRADGSTFPAQVASVSVDNASRPRRLAVVRDLTDVEIAEASVRSLRLAAESAQRALLILDRTRRIVFANAEACALTGYSLEELHGQDPRLVAARGYDEVWWRGLEQAGASRPWKGKVGIEGPGVSGKVVDVEIIPVTTIGGNVTHFVAVLTEARKGNPLEPEVAPTVAPRDSLIAFLADPVADALDSVKGITEQVLASPMLAESLRTDVRAVFDRSAAALRLVREFEWALGRHTEEGSPARGDLVRVLEDAIAKVDDAVVDRALEVRRDQRVDAAPVQAPVLLREALVRILSFAAAGDPGDPVVVEVALVEMLRNGQPHFRLRVAARGGPQGEAERARLLELPRAGEPVPKNSPQGALALCRILAELVGGTLFVESRVPGSPEEGTAFVLIVPALRP